MPSPGIQKTCGLDRAVDSVSVQQFQPARRFPEPSRVVRFGWLQIHGDASLDRTGFAVTLHLAPTRRRPESLAPPSSAAHSAFRGVRSAVFRSRGRTRQAPSLFYVFLREAPSLSAHM